MSIDVKIIETGNGGDAQLLGNDFELVFNNENNIYLGLFGGSRTQSSGMRGPGEQATDHWANELFYPSNKSVQSNSTTERALFEIPLTSSGRVLIENAMKKDLAFMRPFGKITVSATITATDRIETIIKWELPNGDIIISTIKLRLDGEGDFFLFDFNNDFLV